MAHEDTADRIRSIIQDARQNERERYQWHEAVRDIVKKHEGKAPSKRIATAIEKQYPGICVYYSHPFTWTEIVIWGGATGYVYENRQRYMLAYDSACIINMAEYDSMNACTGSAVMERNKKRDEILGDKSSLGHVALIDGWASAITALDDAVEEFKKALPYMSTPDWYDITRLLKNREADRSAINIA